MASDFTKGKGGGWSGKARGAAISRLITKRFGLKPSSLNGIRVWQDNGPRSSVVRVRVNLGEESWDRKEAADWTTQIAEIVQGAGYELVSQDEASLTITRATWRLDDMIFSGLSFTEHRYMESDAELVKAQSRVVTILRNNGWIMRDTLELTELGEQVRARLLALKRQRENAEKRRVRERGW